MNSRQTECNGGKHRLDPMIFVIFRPYEKKLDYQLNLKILDNSTNKSISLECKDYVKYLGLLIDNL